jgi:hypothetical protein
MRIDAEQIRNLLIFSTYIPVYIPRVPWLKKNFHLTFNVGVYSQTLSSKELSTINQVTTLDKIEHLSKSLDTGFVLILISGDQCFSTF